MYIIVRLGKHKHTTGFAVMEESGLRIGTNGSLKEVNVMILNDIFASARYIIDFTNEMFHEQPPQTFNEQKEQQQSAQHNDDDENGQNLPSDMDEDEDEDDMDDEEEEEFKICIQTKSKQRLVLCTIEGVCCAMLQNQPYFDKNNDSNLNTKGNGTN